MTSPIQYTDEELLGIANHVVGKYFTDGDVEPTWIAAIARVESNGDPFAYRHEAHLSDASIGLCQTLLRTAQWLASDFPKYQQLKYPQAEDLKHPEASMYYCTAFLDWLLNYKGTPRTLEWAVKSYNGGPGRVELPGPERYWMKFERTLAALQGLPAQPVDLSDFSATADTTSLHQVGAGDTLEGIAAARGASAAQLRALNPSALLDPLQPGLLLRVPAAAAASGEGGPEEYEAVPGELYEVAPEDTVWGLTTRFGLTEGELRALNPSVELEPLRAGALLHVGPPPRADPHPDERPAAMDEQADGGGEAEASEGTGPEGGEDAARTYTVVPGDSLWKIAREFDTTVDAIARLNAGTPMEPLQIGTVLTVRQAGFGPPTKSTSRLTGPMDAEGRSLERHVLRSKCDDDDDDDAAEEEPAREQAVGTSSCPRARDMRVSTRPGVVAGLVKLTFGGVRNVWRFVRASKRRTTRGIGAVVNTVKRIGSKEY